MTGRFSDSPKNGSRAKYVEQVDRETGEVMQGCMVYLPYRPRITERWFMAFQDSFEEIAKDPEITGETYKVLDVPVQQARFRKLHPAKPEGHSRRARNEEGKRLPSHASADFQADRLRRPEGWPVKVLPSKPQLRLERKGQNITGSS